MARDPNDLRDLPGRCSHIILQRKVGRLRGSAVKCRQLWPLGKTDDNKCWRHTGQPNDNGRR